MKRELTERDRPRRRWLIDLAVFLTAIAGLVTAIAQFILAARGS